MNSNRLGLLFSGSPTGTVLMSRTAAEWNRPQVFGKLSLSYFALQRILNSYNNCNCSEPRYSCAGAGKRSCVFQSIVNPPQLNPGAAGMLKETGHTVSAPADYVEICLAPVVENANLIFGKNRFFRIKYNIIRC